MLEVMAQGMLLGKENVGKMAQRLLSSKGNVRN